MYFDLFFVMFNSYKFVKLFNIISILDFLNNKGNKF